MGNPIYRRLLRKEYRSVKIPCIKNTLYRRPYVQGAFFIEAPRYRRASISRSPYIKSPLYIEVPLYIEGLLYRGPAI